MALDDKDFKSFYRLQNSRVVKNTEIVTPETLGQHFFLHIAPKPPAIFRPMMPRSAAKTEDNTVPRITVSDNIQGCMNGYSRVLLDFFGDIEQEKNGYIINKFDFDFALKPNNNLVFDAEDTNEHWLVTYDKNTIIYRPTQIGKMFVHKVEYEYSSERKKPEGILEVYLELYGDVLVRLDGKEAVGNGFYKMLIDENKGRDNNWLAFKEMSEIKQSDYLKVKKVSADNLDSNSNPVPLWDKW